LEFGDPIHEQFRFAFTDSNSPLIWDNQGNPDPTNPLYSFTPAGGGRIFTFDDRITPTLASVYIQDDLKAGNWNLGMGLRLGSYHGRNFVQNELHLRTVCMQVTEAACTNRRGPKTQR